MPQFGYMKRIAFAAGVAVLGFGARPAAAQAVEPGTYKVDKAHSTILYKILHMGLTNVYGRFNEFDGTVVVDADPAKSTVELVIKADSLDTGNEKRDQHLRAPDFFNTKQFPDITFKSTKVAKAGDKAYEVSGDMTMMGVTKPVSFKFDVFGAKADRGKTKTGGEGRFTVKRTDFGMKANPMLGDDVEVTVALEAQKQ